MDKLFIKDLEVEAIIGINDWEREIRQLISISLEMNFHTKKAGKSDKLEDSLHQTQLEVAEKILNAINNK